VKRAVRINRKDGPGWVRRMRSTGPRRDSSGFTIRAVRRIGRGLYPAPSRTRLRRRTSLAVTRELGCWRAAENGHTTHRRARSLVTGRFGSSGCAEAALRLTARSDRSRRSTLSARWPHTCWRHQTCLGCTCLTRATRDGSAFPMDGCIGVATPKPYDSVLRIWCSARPPVSPSTRTGRGTPTSPGRPTGLYTSRGHLSCGTPRAQGASMYSDHLPTEDHAWNHRPCKLPGLVRVTTTAVPERPAQ